MDIGKFLNNTVGDLAHAFGIHAQGTTPDHTNHEHCVDEAAGAQARARKGLTILTPR